MAGYSASFEWSEFPALAHIPSMRAAAVEYRNSGTLISSGLFTQRTRFAPRFSFAASVRSLCDTTEAGSWYSRRFVVVVNGTRLFRDLTKIQVAVADKTNVYIRLIAPFCSSLKICCSINTIVDVTLRRGGSTTACMRSHFRLLTS